MVNTRVSCAQDAGSNPVLGSFVFYLKHFKVLSFESNKDLIAGLFRLIQHCLIIIFQANSRFVKLLDFQNGDFGNYHI